MTNSSIKKYFYALLLTSTVLALGACSSSDEQPADTSAEAPGESSSGTNCDYDNAAMQTECERAEAMRN
jgi:hypothetical protein